MAFFWLLYSLDDRLVDPEADGDEEQSQDEVRNHTDDTESCQGKQHDQRGAEDKPGLLHVSPENQVVHCRRKGEHSLADPRQPQAGLLAACVLRAWDTSLACNYRCPSFRESGRWEPPVRGDGAQLKRLRWFLDRFINT